MNTPTREPTDEPTEKRREVPLFGKRPVAIRKATTPAPVDTETPRRVALQKAYALTDAKLAAEPGLSRPQALRLVLGERRDLFHAISKSDPYDQITHAPVDAGAMTATDIYERELQQLADAEKHTDPTLTDAQAVTKALATDAGRAVYAKMRSPDAHLTAIELAAVAKRDIANAGRLLPWRAADCGQFVHDRACEIAPEDPTGAGYHLVSALFPYEWAASRKGF